MCPHNREMTRPQVPRAEAEKAGLAEAFTLDSSHQMKREGNKCPAQEALSSEGTRLRRLNKELAEPGAGRTARTLAGGRQVGEGRRARALRPWPGTEGLVLALGTWPACGLASTLACLAPAP